MIKKPEPLPRQLVPVPVYAQVPSKLVDPVSSRCDRSGSSGRFSDGALASFCAGATVTSDGASRKSKPPVRQAASASISSRLRVPKANLCEKILKREKFIRYAAATAIRCLADHSKGPGRFLLSGV